jgi:hypothetical protein
MIANLVRCLQTSQNHYDSLRIYYLDGLLEIYQVAHGILKSCEEMTTKLLVVTGGTPAFSMYNTFGKANLFIALHEESR